MLTYINITVPRIYEHCPENQTEATCPLRSYLVNDQNLFIFVPRANQLFSNSQDWTAARKAIDEMHSICKECHTKNDQKTR